MRSLFIVGVLLGCCLGLLVGYFITTALAQEPECPPCTWKLAGVGTKDWHLTAEQITQCALSDAPAWSDAWCEDCATVIERLLR